MHHHALAPVSALLIVQALTLVGCGDDADSAGSTNTNPSANGQVTDAWRAYCIATFTEEYDVVDPFGDTLFRARPGQEYLIADFDSARLELVYLTPQGPSTFEIEGGATAAHLPFTSNCTPGQTRSYYAAFTAVSVYDTKERSTKICDLAEGSVAPILPNVNAGYASVGDFELSGPTVYELELNAFSAQCGGASSGFISVPETEVFGATTWLVPVISIVGPS